MESSYLLSNKFLKLCALLVTLFAADLVASEHLSRPAFLRMSAGIASSTVWNIPLWLGTFNFVSKWRFLLALVVSLTGTVTTLFMLQGGLGAVTLSAIIHLAIVIRLLMPASP